jgi:ribosomal-protein-alanine N-acetyltransferase
MCDADLAAVIEIEERAYQFPWSEGIFRDCLRVGYVCRVFAGLQDEVIGYAILSVAAGEGHLLNICIDPQHQGAGLGHQLLEQVLELADHLRVHILFLEVRASNRAAARLYRSAGFREIARRRNYYRAENGREHARILARVIHAPYTRP